MKWAGYFSQFFSQIKSFSGEALERVKNIPSVYQVQQWRKQVATNHSWGSPNVQNLFKLCSHVLLCKQGPSQWMITTLHLFTIYLLSSNAIAVPSCNFERSYLDVSKHTTWNPVDVWLSMLLQDLIKNTFFNILIWVHRCICMMYVHWD